MSSKYILAIDQSTSGTKALLLDAEGNIIERSDLPHKQIIDAKGWVEHDPVEIFNNTIKVVKMVVEKARIDKEAIIGVGISNQRETAVVWDKETSEPEYNAIVWQCARGEAICNQIAKDGNKDLVKRRTGLHLSPYFSAAKISWVLRNITSAEKKRKERKLLAGTMDSFLVYKLTDGEAFKTDYSNASRTQLFNIVDLKWDQEVCDLFDIDITMLAEVCDSDTNFGETDFAGYLSKKIPIHAVFGDSHGALFGQGCLDKGMIKATYGTGSSIMMNIGHHPVFSEKGVVTSLAWGIDGKVSYVLEGNINYTGAVLKWITDDLKLIHSPAESERYAKEANQEDKTYLVPAFTGLGAPYWDSQATGHICGMTRTTGRAELVKAAVECIAYQIADIVKVMSEESKIAINELRVDGGPTKNKYLMQFQSDILDIPVQVPSIEELSGAGTAYAAGIALGLYNKTQLFERMKRIKFSPEMEADKREERYNGWKKAVGLVLTRDEMQ
ncbi:FGGY-family carbohydrate kinase [Cellulosilyticum sp. I15G10I2]|uniref:FGGY-family carbohydrate kinase n=1 Tax=Cellulosilyticum sp. I15G10I2 TaxID=1892843 RepID=UPI0009F398FD